MTVSVVSMRFASLIAASILIPSIARAEVPRLVKDVYPGMYGSTPNEAVVFDGKLFFPATAPTTTPSVGYTNLWSSDRTEAGTTLFAELDPGTSSSPRNLVVVGSKLFFFTLDGSLCTSDGTVTGTKKVVAERARRARRKGVLRVGRQDLRVRRHERRHRRADRRNHLGHGAAGVRG